MIQIAVKRVLRPVVKKLISYPLIRRLGLRILQPFPKLKGWVIRLVQAGTFGGGVTPNRTEGYGERQQRLMNGLEQRRKPHLHE
ncbi:hypothetical protein AAGW18_04575 [Vreelandella titanicae]|uniref:Uncharacterized protein n=1 Tax=Vreelandella titanicae TaxID=664683 RepID=A0A1G8HJK0_9GAMM|nr:MULTISPECIES: hypothetical protein [Halomonas]QKS22701.1 hypothetical protein FX987_00452 [Halomonas titanicae]QNU62202.1 hypothetical protein HZS52_21055 [Halomonas titanicae]UEQ05604.1 hypothetical protein LMS44_06995 [Halomonas profundus]SDI06887.1 hypothetical protein SAMN04487867_101351 [Halomonas titanicae]